MTSDVGPDHLSIYVVTNLVNPLNAREHWSRSARRVKAQREAVCLSVWSALRDPRGPGLTWTVTNRLAPKAIALHCYVGRRLDSHDNLRAACKPLVDGLIDARVIADDRDAARHVFTYTQAVERGRRGVLITIRLREEEHAAR